MADEAIIVIKMEGDLGEQRSAADRPPARAGDAPRLAGREGKAESTFDKILKLLDKFRNSLGDTLQSITGFFLDIVGAGRKAAAKLPPGVTPLQVAAANKPFGLGEKPPTPPPGMEWRRAPQPEVLPTLGEADQPPGFIGPPRPPLEGSPFKPGQLGQKPVYQPGKERMPEVPYQPARPPVQGRPHVASHEPFPGFGWTKEIPAVAGQPGKAAVAGIPAKPGVLAGGQPGTPFLSGAGGAAAGGAALAAVYAVKKLMDASVRAADALGTLSAKAISADADPAQYVNTMATFTKEVGGSIPVIGYANQMLGSFGQGLAQMMGQINGMADRYGQFSPEIAMAQGIADINQMLGDLRRSQQAGPDLVNFINQQSQLQQKIEDTKIRLLQKIMPAVVRGMEMFEKVLPFMEIVFNGLVAITNAIIGGASNVRQGIDEVADGLEVLNRPEAASLPTNIIRQGYPFVDPIEGPQ